MLRRLFMDRINQILNHTLFQRYMEANADKERERIFCKHNMAHVLDVARIAYILNAEENYHISKDMIYGAALLHDIGRHVQYETGEQHAFVSARLAPEILRDCGFEEDEIAEIVDAIYYHGDKKETEDKGLRPLIAKADRMSRACFDCPAAEECKWSAEQKSREMLW